MMQQTALTNSAAATPVLESLTPPTGSPRVVRLGDLLDALHDDAASRHEARRTGRPRGPVTGLAELDRAIGGALEPGVCVLHAPPGAGKTAFALQVAAECGCPALVVSSEMSALDLLRRHVARVTTTPLGRLMSGDLTPEAILALAERAIKAAPDLALADATAAPADPSWILDASRAVKGDTDDMLIVVDSVHTLAEMSGEQPTEYEALNATLAALREIAADLRCPILAIAERNRMSMQKGGMSAGAGTRKLEYGATLVLELGRQDEPTEDRNGEVEVTVTVAKNRNGPSGRDVPLRFSGAYQRFRDA